MAAGERLGGLAPATRAGAQALAPAFDVVVVETVGVGQSETEVAEAADTVVVVVQPGSGDALQFLKAGIMEVPDVLVVTKSDLGEVALRAARDLRAALGSLGGAARRWSRFVDPPGRGDRRAPDALERTAPALDLAATRTRARRLGALADFSPSTASAACARSAAAAPRSGSYPGRTRPLEVAGADACARERAASA